MVPKAFVCHATEDKERFVLSFAKLLREYGVDAWLDKWEMQHGDNLVDKVFEDGIKLAGTFVIVLSEYSVNKPWVREELNVAFINRIAGRCKLIPVLIDDCEVPECLKSTLWERFKTLNDIEESTKKVANSILGITDKPPVGNIPRHVSTAIDIFSDLMRQDQIVLAKACVHSMKADWPMVVFSDFRPQLIELGLTSEEIIESLQILKNRHYISFEWAMGGGLSTFDISQSAFETYLNKTFPHYPSMVDKACLMILNNKLTTNSEIQEATEFSARIVNHILVSLSSRGLLELFFATGGGIRVDSVSPELSRHFRNKAM